MHDASARIWSGFSDLAVRFGACRPEREKQMRKTALILALAIAIPVAAQTPADKPAAPQSTEKPAPQESAKPETAQAETPKPQPGKPSKKHSSKRMEDARHCLDKPTNNEVIKCAEAYL
jgi:hypothetical protein